MPSQLCQMSVPSSVPLGDDRLAIHDVDYMI